MHLLSANAKLSFVRDQKIDINNRVLSNGFIVFSGVNKNGKKESSSTECSNVTLE